MTLFATKLERLSETISLVSARGVTDLAQALEAGRGRLVLAVGSGGSVVAVEFVAHCRKTLALGPTSVMTPMEFVVGLEGRAGAEVWLFSAGGDNPDIAAAFDAAIASDAALVRLITVNADGAVAKVARDVSNAEVVVLPVADPKDGFLATHSMVSMITGLLLAADAVLKPSTSDLAETLAEHAATALSATGSGRCAAGSFRPGDTIILLHDPQLAPIAALIETSLWETGLAAVQRTDFRNFAHGRHVWAARYPGSTVVLGLTTDDSLDVWRGVSAPLPDTIRKQQIHLGDAGRLQIAIGVFEGLAWIDAVGDIAGTDPGKPGHGSFAHAIYDDISLRNLGQGLTPSVRQKAQARALLDSGERCGRSAYAVGRDRLSGLGKVRFTGLVLDYDGTVVETRDRYDPPTQVMLTEILRFLDAGVAFGIATGRGGSVGEMLRSVLPVELQEGVTIGYYNGGYIRPLTTDIRLEPPAADPEIQAFQGWLESSGLLNPGDPLEGRIQLTLPHGRVVSVPAVREALARYPAVAEGRLRVLSSQHSFDIVPRASSKLALVELMGGRSGEPVLTVGDSGVGAGNDYDMLARPHGVSVGSVCGGLDGCWSIFGETLSGPNALLRLLRAARIETGGFRIEVAALGLDGFRGAD